MTHLTICNVLKPTCLTISQRGVFIFLCFVVLIDKGQSWPMTFKKHSVEGVSFNRMWQQGPPLVESMLTSVQQMTICGFIAGQIHGPLAEGCSRFPRPNI